MAALTDAMKWYRLGEPALTSVRLKYLFQVRFFISSDTKLQELARDLTTCVRTVELPKYSIEAEIANAWNLRQVIPTRINFEPVSITFNDTLDNAVQAFIANYMSAMSGNFVESQGGVRTGFDGFGIKLRDAGQDCIIDKIEIIRFHGADERRENLQKEAVTTLWRPKIIDVQHDNLDYSASEAVTWTFSIRYESLTYEESKV
jgi:hypothetical protein